jgi:TetR/AcrR family transcriptional regulator, transcriptional repressor for nem operon
LQGQISEEISDQLDIEKLSEFIHNSLILVRVLAKTTKDKEKLQNIIDSTLAVLD